MALEKDQWYSKKYKDWTICNQVPEKHKSMGKAQRLGYELAKTIINPRARDMIKFMLLSPHNKEVIVMCMDLEVRRYSLPLYESIKIMECATITET